MRKLKPAKSRSAARERADRYFSLFVRASRSVNGRCQCVTCGNWHPWKTPDKQLQLGHWRRRGLEPTRYDERNCAPQCKRCNYFRSGEPERFEEYILQTYGKEALEDVRTKSLMRSNRTSFDYDIIAQEYKDKFNQVKKEKGL